MAGKWTKLKEELTEYARKQGWAIDALIEDLQQMGWKLNDRHLCFLCFALLGFSLKAASEKMGYETRKSVSSACSRSIYKALGNLKTPHDTQSSKSIKWAEIVETCLTLGYYDLSQEKQRENQEKATAFNKLKKYYQQGMVGFSFIETNCSEEEKEKIQKLISELFGN